MAVYKLPNEYQQVEYLESTNSYPNDVGRCWFNIPINIDSTNLKIRGKVSNWTWMGREIGEYVLYTTDGDGYSLWRFLKGKQNILLASVNGDDNDYYFTSAEAEFSTQPFIFEQTNTYINILGNQQVSLSGGQSITVSNVRFFNNAKFRLHFAEIYDGATLALQIIPCFRKSDYEPGLYDVVNGVFYTNQGTGSFILGPEIKYYYSTFNTLLKRRRLLMQHYKSILRGLNIQNQYFPTGINGAGDVCVEIKCSNKSHLSGWAFGSRIGVYKKAFAIIYSQRQNIRFYYNNKYADYNYLFGVPYTLKIDKGVFYVDGNIIGSVTQASFDNGLQIYLCNLNSGGTSSDGYFIDFYYAKIWKNDVLVRDYVPSMVGGVYGLYDKVSGSFGPFIGDGTVSPIL